MIGTLKPVWLALGLFRWLALSLCSSPPKLNIFSASYYHHHQQCPRTLPNPSARLLRRLSVRLARLRPPRTRTHQSARSPRTCSFPRTGGSVSRLRTLMPALVRSASCLARNGRSSTKTRRSPTSTRLPRTRSAPRSKRPLTRRRAPGAVGKTTTATRTIKASRPT